MALMKLAETTKVLSAYATELGSLGATVPAGWLTELVNGMEPLRDFTMAKLIEKCEGPLAAAAMSSSSKTKGPSGVDLAKIVAGLAGILKQAKETKYSDDLLMLVHLMQVESVHLETLLQVLRDTMIPPPPNLDLLASQLRSATGTDQFEKLYAAVASTPIDARGMAYIAKAVYGAKPKSASRQAALEAIRKLHDVGIRTKKSLEAQGGRSAA